MKKQLTTKEKILTEFEGSTFASHEAVVGWLSSKIDEIERETIKSVENLMDEKRAKELRGKFRIFFNKEECPVCGADPVKQREMILKSLSHPKSSPVEEEKISFEDGLEIVKKIQKKKEECKCYPPKHDCQQACPCLGCGGPMECKSCIHCHSKGGRKECI